MTRTDFPAFGTTSLAYVTTVSGPSRLKVPVFVPRATRVIGLRNGLGRLVWFVDAPIDLRPALDALTLFDATHYGVVIPSRFVHTHQDSPE